MCRNIALIAAALALGTAGVAPDTRAAQRAELATLVEADWIAQEARLGRKPWEPGTLDARLASAHRLLECLQATPAAPNVSVEAATLARLEQEVAQARQLDDAGRKDLYRRLRASTRALALENPLLAGRPILLLKQRRFICQMLHEFTGYYYDYGDLAGGGLYVLEEPGRSLQLRDLGAARLGRGVCTTPALSYDGRTIYFAFAPVRAGKRPFPPQGHWVGMLPAERVPEPFNYYSPQRSCFHVYAMDVDGGHLRQLTDGPDDDFDPCPLPDGRVAFLSSRRGGFCRCDNDYEPVPTYTLHVMQGDGRGVRTLSVHETNEWSPAVLNDGRMVYSRWDYVDRSAAHFHGLWVSNPDGSNPAVLFGNYTQQISACFQPRAIPGSRKIVFVAGSHHSVIGGSLALFDPGRAKLDPQTGEDRFESIERLTPEVCFPEAPREWPKSFFHSPWPLSEDFFLVSLSLDPLPGMVSHVLTDSQTGIYYLDRFGNLELLYRDAAISAMYPQPLTARPAPPTIADTRESTLDDEGEFLLADVRWSHLALPPERPIRQLRVFEVLPKETTHVANRPRIGHANAEGARLLLGTVPVEADGSAYFRAPARKPLYFQAVDAAGHAVQGMRSVTYLQPGERRACVGCHERPGVAPAFGPRLAFARAPSILEPGPDGSRPLSFPRLVQPVLDRHCLRCHDARPNAARPLLTGDRQGTFSRSYTALRPWLRWYEWGQQSIAEIVTRPGHQGADESRLLAILADAHHAAEVRLPPDDRQRLLLWLDANVPFYGTYRDVDQQAQRDGKRVAVPALQ